MNIRRGILDVWALVVISIFLYDILFSGAAPMSSILSGRASAGGYVFFTWQLIVVAFVNYLVLFGFVVFLVWITGDVLRLAKNQKG